MVNGDSKICAGEEEEDGDCDVDRGSLADEYGGADISCLILLMPEALIAGFVSHGSIDLWAVGKLAFFTSSFVSPGISVLLSEATELLAWLFAVQAVKKFVTVVQSHSTTSSCAERGEQYVDRGSMTAEFRGTISKSKDSKSKDSKSKHSKSKHSKTPTPIKQKSLKPCRPSCGSKRELAQPAA